MGARLSGSVRGFRGRLLAAGICAAGIGLLCGCAGGTPAAAAAPFVPGGGATTSAPTQSASAAAAIPGLQNFTFPSSVKVVFQTPLPASGPARSAVIAYENYIDSMWYAVYTHGTDTSYQKYVFGNALSFVQQEIREFTNGNDQLRGTITYFNISVPNVFFKAGAVVSSCVDSSQMQMVDEQTGKVATLFSSSFSHYMEQAGTGKIRSGLWIVNHTDNFSGSAAGVCAE